MSRPCRACGSPDHDACGPARLETITALRERTEKAEIDLGHARRAIEVWRVENTTLTRERDEALALARAHKQAHEVAQKCITETEAERDEARAQRDEWKERFEASQSVLANFMRAEHTP